MADEATHYRWEDLPREELNPLIGRRYISGDSMMIAHIYLAKGAIVPKHEHVNEQITYVIEGRMRFSLGEDDSQHVEVGPEKCCTFRRTSRIRRRRSRTRSTSTSSIRRARTGWTAATPTYVVRRRA